MKVKKFKLKQVGNYRKIVLDLASPSSPPPFFLYQGLTGQPAKGMRRYHKYDEGELSKREVIYENNIEETINTATAPTKTFWWQRIKRSEGQVSHLEETVQSHYPC